MKQPRFSIKRGNTVATSGELLLRTARWPCGAGVAPMIPNQQNRASASTVLTVLSETGWSIYYRYDSWQETLSRPVVSSLTEPLILRKSKVHMLPLFWVGQTLL